MPCCRVLPGADGAFAGGQDDTAVVLSNSGRFVSVYETSKLSSAAAKPLYSAELKEGLMAAVYPGGHGGSCMRERPEARQRDRGGGPCTFSTRGGSTLPGCGHTCCNAHPLPCRPACAHPCAARAAAAVCGRQGCCRQRRLGCWGG